MSRNLLVYESDATMADALKTLFSNYKFKVFTASSEARVQEALGKDRIDIFIIRAENPGMKGFMLCKKIRSIDGYATTPILLISSNATEEVFEKHRQFDYRADYYLTIPCDNETILAATHALFPFLEDMQESAGDTSGKDRMIAELKQKISELEAILNETKNQPLPQADQEEMETIAQENEKLAELNALLTDNLSKIESESGELKDALAQKSFQLKGLEEKIAELEKHAQSASAMEKEKMNLNTELNIAKNESEKTKAQIEKLEEAAVIFNEELTELKEENKNLKKTVKELETASDSAKNDIKELAEMKKKLAEQKDQNDVLNVYNKEMKDRVRKFETDFAELTSRKEKAEAELEKMTKLKDSELAEKKKVIEEAENEMAELKNAVSGLAELNEELEKIKKEKEALAKNNDTLREEIQELTDTVTKGAEVAEQFETLLVEKKDLEEKLNERRDRVKDLNDEMDKLSEKIEMLDSTIAENEEMKTKLTEDEAKLEENAKKIEEMSQELTILRSATIKHTEILKKLRETISEFKD